ncbi:lipopolysaccharide biosynthesis protein [Roseimaritima ulvae]|nr:hypothetical protein [Roseimaritima ulvae]
MNECDDEPPEAARSVEVGTARLPWQPLTRLAKPSAVMALLAVGQGAALLSLLLISHRCSAEVFGQLTTGLAIQNYVVLAGTLGLRTLVVRDLARTPDAAGAVWGTLWSLTALPGALIACCGYLISGLLLERTPAEDQMSLYLSCGAWCSMMSVVPLLDSLNKQIHAMVVVALTEVVFLALLQTGRIPFRVDTLGLAFALKWAAASWLQAAVFYWLAKPIDWHFSPRLFRRWRVAAAPLLATSLLMNLPISGAVVLARFFQSAADTAAIGLAGQLAGAVILLGGVGVRFIQPVWRDRQSLKDPLTFRRVLAMGAVGGAGWFTLIIAITVFTWTALPIEYLRGIGSIYLCLLAAAFGVVARVLWIALVAAEREVRVLWAYGFGGIVFVAVSLLLAPWLGGVGCAMGAAAGTGCTAWMMWHAIRFVLPRLD